MIREHQSMPDELIKAALRYAARGWRVIPLRRVSKRPLISGWQIKATTDPKTIRHWWEEWPHANIGIVTGSGLLVLGFDV
jgi:hypothetical protein